ncbi:MAG: methyltransferase domain-containing protein [Actinomycetota bacterium]
MCFEQLERFNIRPTPFSAYTAEDLWNDPHISERMLALHLDGDVAMASPTAEFIERAVAWITHRCAIDDASRVLDLGCGPGLYANPIARTGAAVVGVDFSERSIRFAERSADPEASPTFILGNYLEVDVPGDFDLVLMAMYDFCALSPDQRHQLLDRIREWVRPGGRFVFDVYALRALNERQESVTYAPNLMDGFWSAHPYHGFLRTFVYPERGVTLDKYEIIEAHRTRTIYNWLQHFDQASIAKELDGAGFVVDEFRRDLAGTERDSESSEFCVVAQSR